MLITYLKSQCIRGNADCHQESVLHISSLGSQKACGSMYMSYKWNDGSRGISCLWILYLVGWLPFQKGSEAQVVNFIRQNDNILLGCAFISQWMYRKYKALQLFKAILGAESLLEESPFICCVVRVLCGRRTLGSFRTTTQRKLWTSFGLKGKDWILIQAMHCLWPVDFVLVVSF